jgi:hypothetical protein
MFGLKRNDSQKKSQFVSTPKLEQLELREVPAIIANPDTYTVKAGTVLNAGQVTGVPGTGGQPPTVAGVLANDYSDTNPGVQLSIQGVTTGTFITAKYTNSKTPLPASSLRLNQDGSFYFVAPPDIPPNAGNVTFNYTVINGKDLPAVGTVTIIIEQDVAKFVAVGADAGGGPHVRVFDQGTSVLRYNFFPYEASFTGGVRVAVGDVTNDGTDDIITMPNVGGGPRLRVFSGKDGSTVLDTFAFDPNFRGGGYVTVGDYNGDGQKDIILGAGEGGGPRVSVLTLAGTVIGSGNFNTLGDFFAFDSTLQTGVRVAAGNLRDLNRDFIVTTPGSGTGSFPEVRVYDGATILAGLAPQPVNKFYAFDGNVTTGVNISTGDFRGDGKFDILVGTADGPGIVRIFDGRTSGLVREFRVPVDETTTGTGNPLSGPTSFTFQNAPLGNLLSPSLQPSSLVSAANGAPFTGTTTGGVRVAAVDWNGDGIDDIIAGAGPGNVSRVRIFNTLDQAEIVNYLAFNSNFLGGVNVGAGN